MLSTWNYYNTVNQLYFNIERKEEREEGRKRDRQTERKERKKEKNSFLDSCVIKLCTSSFSSVQFSCSVVSDSLRSHGLQHSRPPCPSPAPAVYSNSCPLSWWCHPTISFSAVPLLIPLSIFPSIRVISKESFLCIRWPKSWSFSFSVSPPVNIQGWFPLGWTGWLSL